MSAAVLAAYDTLAKGSKSFAFASRLLPARARPAAAVLYAWCRRVDDAVDLAPDVPSAKAALERERALLEEVYGAGELSDPLLVALRDVVVWYRIPRAYPMDLLEGMAMDVRGERYDGVDDLLLYCYRVAGTVGLMMAHVMGVSRPSALRHASHLGIAMQLTNICRDVAEDAGRGRVYLPRALLGEGAGTSASLDPDRVKPAVQTLLGLADRYYRSADAGLAHLPWQSALAIRTARLVYAGIGDVIIRRRYDVLSGRAFVPLWRKLGLLVRALWAAAREWPQRPPFQPVPLPEVVRTDDCIRL